MWHHQWQNEGAGIERGLCHMFLRYWVNTLSASPLISNRDFAAGCISDIAEKLEQAESSIGPGVKMGRCEHYAQHVT
jgi:hypothetical protein